MLATKCMAKCVRIRCISYYKLKVAENDHGKKLVPFVARKCNLNELAFLIFDKKFCINTSQEQIEVRICDTVIQAIPFTGSRKKKRASKESI